MKKKMFTLRYLIVLCFFFYFLQDSMQKKTEKNEFLSNIQRFESSENSKITDRCRYSEIELRRKRKFHRVQYLKKWNVRACDAVAFAVGQRLNVVFNFKTDF